MALQPIEDRIRGSLKYGAINGDTFERSICEKQMKEAADEIVALRATLAAERARLAPVIEAAEKVEEHQGVYVNGRSLAERYVRLLIKAIREYKREAEEGK